MQSMTKEKENKSSFRIFIEILWQGYMGSVCDEYLTAAIFLTSRIDVICNMINKCRTCLSALRE